VTAYSGRGQVEPFGQVCRGGRTVDQDRPDDALARRLVDRAAVGTRLVFEFHNASVPLML
jgi:hypothetical protein